MQPQSPSEEGGDARYGEMGIARLRTDELGALTLDFDDGLRQQAWRQARARCWYAP